MTNISNTISKLCLITPGVCVGGGGATYFALKTFFIHVTENTDQNEQMLWPNCVFARRISKISNFPNFATLLYRSNSVQPKSNELLSYK